jgi:hypothetical protein
MQRLDKPNQIPAPCAQSFPYPRLQEALRPRSLADLVANGAELFLEQIDSPQPIRNGQDRTQLGFLLWSQFVSILQQHPTIPLPGLVPHLILVLLRFSLNAPPYQVHLMIELLHHVEAVSNDPGMRQFLPHSLTIGFPHVHRHNLDGTAFVLRQTIQPFLERLLEPIEQHGNHPPSFQIGEHQRILLVSLPQQNLIHAQSAYSPTSDLAGSTLCLPFEDSQHGRFTQPFLERHLLARRFVLHSFVDVHLEAPGLSSLGIDPLRVFCEGLATYGTIKTPLRRMHQRLHSPDVQVTDTTLLLFVNFVRHLQTTWAYGHIVFMFTEQVQILFLVFFLDGTSSDSHSQQIAQGFRRHCLRRQTIYSFHCSCCISGYLLR